MIRLLACCLLLITVHATAQFTENNYKFVENKGQWPDQVMYRVTGSHGHIFLEQHRLLYYFIDNAGMKQVHVGGKLNPGQELVKSHLLYAHFVGSNKVTSTKQSQRSKEYYNFFMGNDPAKWATGLYGYGNVVLEDLYDGIDLKMYDKDWVLKYDFIVDPGANPKEIRVKYINFHDIKLDKAGNLTINTPVGYVEEYKPYAYQIRNGNLVEIPCEFKLDGDQITFEVGDYNPDVELVIDPTLIFSTYAGSLADNFGMTATYDYEGNALSAGMVYGNEYPTDSAAYDTVGNLPNSAANPYGNTDVFISKYNPTGTNMEWTTYYGGGSAAGGTETAHSLICDTSNNVYILGATSSDDCPMVNSYDNSFAGGVYKEYFYNGVYFRASNGSTTVNAGTDIYVAKFTPDGLNLLGSTYVGGSDNDGVNYYQAATNFGSVAEYDSLVTNYGDQFRGEIMLDENEDVYITSCTRSTDFPTVNPFQPALSGQQDAVVFKLSNDLSTLVWSSYLGGTGNDAGYSIKVDAAGNSYAVGGTSSSNFPTAGTPYQAVYGGGSADGWIAKISPNGGNLMNSSFVGSAAYDQIFFCDLDRIEESLYFIGQNNAPFPVSPGAYNNANSGQFIWKMDTALATLDLSTVFGNGSGGFNISPSAFLVDRCGNVYVSGWGANILQATPLGGMPVTSDAYQQNAANGFDFYIFVLEQGFQNILYGSYFGGPLSNEHVDGGTSRFDSEGIVYQSVCAGCGGNSDFPCEPNPGAWSCQNLSTNCNNGVFKMDLEIQPVANFTVDNLTGCAPLTVTFTNNSINNTNYLWDFGNGDTTSTNPSPTQTYTDTGTFFVYLTIEDSVCALWDTALQVITVLPELQLTTMNDTLICDSVTLSIWASAIGHDGTFIWSSNNQFTDTLNTNLSDSVLVTQVIQPGWYYVQVQNPQCTHMDSVFIDFTANSLTLNPLDICTGESGVITATGGNPGDPIISYEWWADSIIVSGDSTSSVTVNPWTTQYVYMQAISQSGCIILDSALVQVFSAPPNMTAWADMDTIGLGGSTGIHVSPNGYPYTWTPPDDIADPNAASTTVTPSSLGPNTYIVATGTGGCYKSDTITIWTFELVCEEPNIFVPNAFTPNLDGHNDVLYARANNLTDVYFTVYDRWGEMMFETTDLSIGWDGFFKGKKCDPDVYVYYLRGLCIDEQDFFKKGNVTLIR